MNIQDGGPAFPDVLHRDGVDTIQHGMSKREYMATQIFSTLAGQHRAPGAPAAAIADAAAHAVRMADELLSRLERQ